MSDTVSTFDRFAETTVRRAAFTSELMTLPDNLRGGFVRNYADAERRYIEGTMDAARYSGIVGELVRDIRGTRTAVETAKRRGTHPAWMAGHVATSAPVSAPVSVTDRPARGTLRLGRRA